MSKKYHLIIKHIYIYIYIKLYTIRLHKYFNIKTFNEFSKTFINYKLIKDFTLKILLSMI